MSQLKADKFVLYTVDICSQLTCICCFSCVWSTGNCISYNLSVNFIALCIENDQLGHCVCVFSYSNLGIILSWSGKHCIYYFMSMSLLTCLESDQLYNVLFMPIWKLFFSQIWQTHCWILFYYLWISLLTCLEHVWQTHCWILFYYLLISLLTCLESDQLYNVFFMPIWKLFFSQIWQTHCWILFYYLWISLLTCLGSDQLYDVFLCQSENYFFPRSGKLTVEYYFIIY